MGKIIKLIQSLHEQNLDSTLINKLYNMLHKKQDLNDDTINLDNSNIVGEITFITPVYRDYVDYIRNVFVNLVIHATDYYVRFYDSKAEEQCARLYGDGVGVTENQLAAVTSMRQSDWGPTCQIVDFPEFKYFTGIKVIDEMFTGSTANQNTTLRTITLPNSITYIGRSGYAGGFYGTSIESIIIPDNVTIRAAAFYNCKKLKHVTLGYGCYIDMQAFYKCTLLENFDLNGATYIGTSAFIDCLSMTSIVIPNTVNGIGDSVFSGSGITSLTFESGNDNNPLTLQGSTNGYRPGTFRLMNSDLKYIILPKRLTELKDNALGNTTKINFVFTSTTPPSVTGNGELGYVDESWLYVPDEAIEAYKAAPGFSDWISNIKPASEFVA